MDLTALKSSVADLKSTADQVIAQAQNAPADVTQADIDAITQEIDAIRSELGGSAPAAPAANSVETPSEAPAGETTAAAEQTAPAGTEQTPWTPQAL